MMVSVLFAQVSEELLLFASTLFKTFTSIHQLYLYQFGADCYRSAVLTGTIRGADIIVLCSNCNRKQHGQVLKHTTVTQNVSGSY